MTVYPAWAWSPSRLWLACRSLIRSYLPWVTVGSAEPPFYKARSWSWCCATQPCTCFRVYLRRLRSLARCFPSPSLASELPCVHFRFGRGNLVAILRNLTSAARVKFLSPTTSPLLFSLSTALRPTDQISRSLAFQSVSDSALSLISNRLSLTEAHWPPKLVK